MKIFLGGAVSSASRNQLAKYNIYKNALEGFAKLSVPDDIWTYRQKCIDENPDKSKFEIDKMMVDYDLQCVKNTDLMICDISQQSTGLGIELGIVYENNIKIIFFYEKGSYISNMITGAFSASLFIEYDDLQDLEEKVRNYINSYKK